MNDVVAEVKIWRQNIQFPNPDKLISQNAIAIGQAFNPEPVVKDDSFNYIDVDIEFMERSGWLDYIRTYQNLDPFPYTGHGLMVVDGVIYNRYIDPILSIYRAKLFSIPGMLPVKFMYSPDRKGYIYLYPMAKVEEFGRYITRKYVDILHEVPPPADREGDIGPYTNVIDEIIKDPIFQEAMGIIDSIHPFSIDSQLVAVTDDSGTTKAYAFPNTMIVNPNWIIHDCLLEIATHIDSGITPEGVWQEGYTTSIENYLLRLISARHPRELKEYVYPEISESEARAIDTAEFSNGFTLEAIMALAVNGYNLDDLKDKNPSLSIFGHFIANLSEDMPYLRFPITNYGYRVQDFPNSRLPHYQSDRTSEFARRMVRDSRATPTDETFNWQQVPPGDRPDYSHMGPARRLARILDEKELKEGKPRHDRWHEDSRWYAMGAPMSATILTPLKHDLKYISIHGVTFLADEIVRIFHNTPLASAVALGSIEYDPPWLSINEVKNMRDLLSGMIMPYTFYLGLSLDAYINLSGNETFLQAYESLSRDGDLDKWFILGERMVDWLRIASEEIEDIKRSGNMETIFSLVE